MKRHGLDPVSLVTGVILAALGVGFFTDRIQLNETSFAWFWPLTAVAIGAVIVASSLSGGARSERDDTPTDEDAGEGSGPYA
jgi:hypothetical protein